MNGRSCPSENFEISNGYVLKWLTGCSQGTENHWSEEETMIKLVINHIISDQSGNQQGNSAESLLVKVE